MATHRGLDGVVKIGANTIAEVNSWSLDENTDMLEDTTMGDAAKTYQAGLKGWSGQLSCWWDPSDANGQELLNNGESATLHLGPGGAGSGDTYYEGVAIISGLVRGGEKEGIVTAEFSFQGSGVLTQGTEA